MKKIIVMIVLVLCVSSLLACSPKNDETLRVEDIRAVCELATLKCYYNNVAQIEKKADNIFQKDRKMWIEYEGEAVIGVDMAKVEIQISGNAVKITMPNAEILSIKPITKSLTEDSYICSADGWLVKNKITTEDQEKAINKGQEEMKNAVLGNQGLFLKAEERAKELIKNYITKLGEAIGKDYTIEWGN